MPPLLVAFSLSGAHALHPSVARSITSFGGLIAANYLFNDSPKVGSEVGMFPGNIASLPLMKPAQVKYDVRLFHWIGSPATEIMLCVVASGGSVKTFSNLFHQEKVTGTAGTATHDTPAVLNSLSTSRFCRGARRNGFVPDPMAHSRRVTATP
jgi:hypothetical protein